MRKDLNIVVKGTNLKVTDALKQYVNEKIGRLVKYFDRLQGAEVELTCQDHKSAEESQRVQVTLNANGTIFRCEESSISMYASIDIVTEKLERQLKRYKQKLYSKARSAKPAPFEDIEGDLPEANAQIVKVKRFAIKPMTVSEASMQMEMLNHNFFMFLNPDSEQVNVIYKRGDGNYGLIEPEFE